MQVWWKSWHFIKMFCTYLVINYVYKKLNRNVEPSLQSHSVQLVVKFTSPYNHPHSSTRRTFWPHRKSQTKVRQVFEENPNWVLCAINSPNRSKSIAPLFRKETGMWGLAISSFFAWFTCWYICWQICPIKIPELSSECALAMGFGRYDPVSGQPRTQFAFGARRVWVLHVSCTRKSGELCAFYNNFSGNCAVTCEWKCLVNL